MELESLAPVGDPLESFLTPGDNQHLSLISQPEQLWRPVGGARIDTFGIADFGRANRQWARHWQTISAETMLSQIVEFASAPAIAEDLRIVDSCVSVGGKWFLGGPAGERLALASHHAWRRRSSDEPDLEPWGTRLEKHFEMTRASGGGLPPLAQSSAQGLDFVIEARNLNNYFHFTKEVLCALTMVEDIPDFTGKVVIVGRQTEPPVFVRRWINVLFPELAKRIQYMREPFGRERAIIAWHGDQAKLQDTDATGELWEASHDLAAPFSPGYFRALRYAGYTAALRRLRDRARQMAARLDMSHLSKRFWVTRSAEGSADRAPKAEPEIIGALAKRGFAALAFETLEPVEQVAAMANAEVVVAYHGAGLANMLYASPETHVIELGTFQSAKLRTGDFCAFAHAAQCRYTVGTADFEHEDNDRLPPMRGHGIFPIQVSAEGLRKLLAFVDDNLPA